jgi:hypothetical protein
MPSPVQVSGVSAYIPRISLRSRVLSRCHGVIDDAQGDCVAFIRRGVGYAPAVAFRGPGRQSQNGVLEQPEPFGRLVIKAGW